MQIFVMFKSAQPKADGRRYSTKLQNSCSTAILKTVEKYL